MNEIIDGLLRGMPATLSAVVAVAVLMAANYILTRREAGGAGEHRLVRQLIMLALTGLAIVSVVLTLPIAESTRNQLLALLGLVLTALIALSSTTFVANAMAGIMMRSVRNFTIGDFVRVGEHEGRVTERGLFHVEVQTEDSDLTTLPNLLLVSNPVTVVRSNGTIVSAQVSLGYDVAHSEIEPVLIDAATAAGLEKPFVQVVELEDHAVVYRLAGFLTEVKFLLTARSNLRKTMLDALHGAQIEIVSPSYMAQRPLAADARILPKMTTPKTATPKTATPTAPAVEQAAPEDMAFEKADAAERLENARKQSEQLTREIADLERELSKADETVKRTLEQGLERKRSALATLKSELDDT